MAHGNRNAQGRPTDFVRHYGEKDGGDAICGNRRAGYVANDWNDVTCKKCIEKVNKGQWRQ